MRVAVFALASILAACASQASPSSAPPKPSVPPPELPAPVAAAAAHVVLVFIEATCETLGDATAIGTGFYVAPRVIATADHALQAARDGAIPDFAIVGEGGCSRAVYGNRIDTLDTLLLLAHNEHAGHLNLAARLPENGEILHRRSFNAYDETTGTAVFGDAVVVMEPLPPSRVFYAAAPHPPESGESGSPLIDSDGNVVGMTLASGKLRSNGKPIGVYVSSLAIRVVLAQCGGGGPCSEE
ncbi:MAG: hypothetical protein QY323_00385 [Patescibacteria group bacterium]|nr:MAG: hypothetical protein QY323_00385 [Patescibacteria group bacterium]